MIDQKVATKITCNICGNNIEKGEKLIAFGDGEKTFEDGEGAEDYAEAFLPHSSIFENQCTTSDSGWAHVCSECSWQITTLFQSSIDK